MTPTPVQHLVERLETLRSRPRRDGKGGDRWPRWTSADAAALGWVLGNYDGPAGDPALLERASRPGRGPQSPEEHERRQLGHDLRYVAKHPPPRRPA